MSNCKIPCFICGQELKGFDPISVNHPISGIEFTSYGHFGTTVFDPMDGTELAINFCDPCLEDGIRKQRVLHLRAGAYADQATIYKCPRMPPAFEAGES